jgi:hypothetical protein
MDIMRRVQLVAVGGLVAVCSVSCVRRVEVGYYDERPRHSVIYVDEGHHCHPGCPDHFWNGSRVVVLSGHRHGPGCGHHFYDGRWVVFDDHGDHVHVSSSHICNHNCHDHYWDGNRVVVLSGHRHGPGCGHYFHDGHWTLSVSLGGGGVQLGASHICSSACHDHYWNGAKYISVSGHRHGPGCGHVFSKNRWVMGKAKATPEPSHRVSPGKSRAVSKQPPGKSKAPAQRTPPGRSKSKKQKDRP